MTQPDSPNDTVHYEGNNCSKIFTCTWLLAQSEEVVRAFQCVKYNMVRMDRKQEKLCCDSFFA